MSWHIDIVEEPIHSHLHRRIFLNFLLQLPQEIGIVGTNNSLALFLVIFLNLMTQSAGAAEYHNWISAEG